MQDKGSRVKTELNLNLGSIIGPFLMINFLAGKLNMRLNFINGMLLIIFLIK